MPVAHGTFDVTIEAEPPFFEIDNAAGKHSCVLQYELR